MEKELLFKSFRQKCKDEIDLIISKIHFSRNNQANGIHRMAVLSISCLVMMFSLSGCATWYSIHTGSKAPIFLKISTADLEKTQFFLDGKPVKWEMVEFSRNLIAQNGVTDTYEVISYPAIKVNPVNKYYTLTVKNEQYQQKDILLKRNIAQETSLYLFVDLYCTAGIGTLIDICDNSLMRLPGIDMESVANNKNTAVFYNTQVQTKLTPSSVNKNK